MMVVAVSLTPRFFIPMLGNPRKLNSAFISESGASTFLYLCLFLPPIEKHAKMNGDCAIPENQKLCEHCAVVRNIMCVCVFCENYALFCGLLWGLGKISGSQMGAYRQNQTSKSNAMELPNGSLRYLYRQTWDKTESSELEKNVEQLGTPKKHWNPRRRLTNLHNHTRGWIDIFTA